MLTDNRIDELMLQAFPRTRPSAAYRNFARLVLAEAKAGNVCGACDAIGAHRSGCPAAAPAIKHEVQDGPA